ncbi:hypothetical protein EV360DRAFT_88028 [Lentinula raphanica]|nr:hypothetical protein EV360DRAFT_88028 [Lentinula raphanica]
MEHEELDYRRFIVPDSSVVLHSHRNQTETQDGFRQSPHVQESFLDTTTSHYQEVLLSTPTIRHRISRRLFKAPFISLRLCGSIVFAIVSALLGMYSSFLRSCLTSRLSLISCAALNLVWAVFMDEPFPQCSHEGFHILCAHCPSTFLPLPTQIATESRSPFVAPDYALGPDGAIVIALTSPTFSGSSSIFEDHSKTEKAFLYATPPLAVIEEDVRIGRCWRFPGSSGFITIKLAAAIRLTNLTIHYPDHRELPSWKHEQIPKTIKLWALLPPHIDLTPALRQRSTTWDTFDNTGNFVKPFLLEDASTFVEGAMISYDAKQGTMQTFATQYPVPFWTTVVVIDVLDNWGSNTTTCLHRIAIHGEEKAD